MRPQDLVVKFGPNDHGNPPGKLADAELHFSGETECRCCAGSKWIQTRTGGGDLRLDGYDVCHGSGKVPSPLAGLKLIDFGIWERRGATGAT